MRLVIQPSMFKPWFGLSKLVFCYQARDLLSYMLKHTTKLMMAQAKIIYILMVKETTVFFSIADFSKRNRKHILCVSTEL